MQLLPMASSPDRLISARRVVITKTPGWEGEGIAPHNGSTKTAAVPVLPQEILSSPPSISNAFWAT